MKIFQRFYTTDSPMPYLVEDKKWYELGISPELRERDETKWFYHASFGYSHWHYPFYIDMVDGQRWQWCWTRKNEGQVVIHLYFLDLDAHDRKFYNIGD